MHGSIWGITACLSYGSHHYLTNLVSRIWYLASLLRSLLQSVAKSEIWAFILVWRWMVFFRIDLLWLFYEATRSMASFLRAHSHVVKLSLLRSHDTVIAIKDSHRSLDASMKGWSISCLTCDRVLLMSNHDPCFLRGGKLMNEAARGWVGWSFTWGTLVSCRHGLNYKVLVAIITFSLHLYRLKLLL